MQTINLDVIIPASQVKTVFSGYIHTYVFCEASAIKCILTGVVDGRKQIKLKWNLRSWKRTIESFSLYPVGAMKSFLKYSQSTMQTLPPTK